MMIVYFKSGVPNCNTNQFEHWLSLEVAPAFLEHLKWLVQSFGYWRSLADYQTGLTFLGRKLNHVPLFGAT